MAHIKSNIRPIQKEFEYTTKLFENTEKANELSKKILTNLYKENLELNQELILKNREAKNEKMHVYKLSSELESMQKVCEELPSVIKALSAENMASKENLNSQIRQLEMTKSLNDQKIKNLRNKINLREKLLGVRFEPIQYGVKIVLFNLLENNPNYECNFRLKIENGYKITDCNPKIDFADELKKFCQTEDFKLFMKVFT
ncbi:hypothetical protein MHBO_002337 [Bonamia ostreae]|uniref:Kinetochore protein SPC25 n=1 Tax=Bonamia ostreae TaxID=126728 RepID=A0ABV2AMS2_9EUKA